MAQTVGYMVAGYTVIFVGLIGYVASLVIRTHNLHQDENLLKEIEKKQK
jgi:hypothetical protein